MSKAMLSLFGTIVLEAGRVKFSTAHSQTAYMDNLSVLEHPIVLRHPAISEQLRVISRLLCTSKTVAAAVCNHAAGLLDVDMKHRLLSSQTAELDWISRNSDLVRSLILSTWRPCRFSAEVQQLACICSRYSKILHSLELVARPMDTDTVRRLAALISEHGAKLSTFQIDLTNDPDKLLLWEQLLADAMQQAYTNAAGFSSKPCQGEMQYAEPPGRLPGPSAVSQQQQEPGEPIAGQTAGTPESNPDFPRLPNLLSFGIENYRASTALLEFLPATLIELRLSSVIHPISDEDVTQMKAALGRLTNLQSLRTTVVDLDFVNVSSMVARLPMQSLTSLTMLELTGLQDVSFAAVLPAALKRLQITTSHNAVVSPLVIGHLTQLTHLHFGTFADDSPGIMPGSALPASLEQLHCFDIASNVLTSLTNLGKLAVRSSTISGSSFAEVGEALTRLEEVELAYRDDPPVTQQTSLEADIIGWSNIPLTKLGLSLGGYLNTDGGSHQSVQQQLTAGLSNLGRLQTLTTLWLKSSHSAGVPVIDTDVLVRSLSKLSSLRFLGLRCVQLTGGDVALTRLSEVIDRMPDGMLDLVDVDTRGVLDMIESIKI